MINFKDTKTIWVYGPSGVGKTRWVANYLLNELKINSWDIFIWYGTTRPFPRLEIPEYAKEATVLWIENIHRDLPVHNDIYELLIEGRFEIIIFSSMFHPKEIFIKQPWIIKMFGEIKRFEWPNNIAFTYPPIIK